MGKKKLEPLPGQCLLTSRDSSWHLRRQKRPRGLHYATTAVLSNSFYRCSSKCSPAMRCSIYCRRAAVLAAIHARPHDHSYCNLSDQRRQQPFLPLTGSGAAPAPRRSHARSRGKGPLCSIEAVGENFPKKRICKVVLLFSGAVRADQLELLPSRSLGPLELGHYSN